MILFQNVSIPASVLGTPEYVKLCYIYALADEHNHPFYVGSTKNLGSRFLTHLSGDCVDSAPKIRQMQRAGHTPKMVVIDVTMPANNQERYAVEGFSINRLLHLGYRLANSQTYPNETKRVLVCKTCFRSQRFGTL